MTNVMHVVKTTKQPWGGYIRPAMMTVTQLHDQTELNTNENIRPTLIGICVDYLSRYSRGVPKSEAFKISLHGSNILGDYDNAMDLLAGISGMGAASVTNACQLVGYDVVYRSGVSDYKPVDEIHPDGATVENIKTMVGRTDNFISSYGPVVLDGFDLSGGYTEKVTAGDGDFATQDTLWELKVSKKGPTKEHTLQLLMYYLMGMRAGRPEFESVTHLGVFNPRLNTVYRISLDDIPAGTVDEVSRELIGYK